MNDKTFQCAERPFAVFGNDVDTKPFKEDDVDKVLHISNSDEEFVGVFQLFDGRYASVFHKKHDFMQIEDQILTESVAHVASSYEKIVNLGLTDSTRDVLGI